MKLDSVFGNTTHENRRESPGTNLELFWDFLAQLHGNIRGVPWALEGTDARFSVETSQTKDALENSTVRFRFLQASSFSATR